MLSAPIQTLVEYFIQFPGVGPKQATRFVFYLLREDRKKAEAIAAAIARLHAEVNVCEQCYKTFNINQQSTNSKQHCEICRDSKRVPSELMIVEKEVDLENIERTQKYQGLYHVLDGIVSPLDSSAPARLHLKELFERIQKLAAKAEGVEVILATNPTAEGDATALYIERIIAPLKNQHSGLKLSRLGRGLTTGSELEYSDDITIANALLNRK